MAAALWVGGPASAQTCGKNGPQISTGSYEIWSSDKKTSLGHFISTGSSGVGKFPANTETFLWTTATTWPYTFYLKYEGAVDASVDTLREQAKVIEELSNIPNCASAAAGAMTPGGAQQWKAKSSVSEALLVRTMEDKTFTQLIGYWPVTCCPSLSATNADPWIQLSKHIRTAPYKSSGTAN